MTEAIFGLIGVIVGSSITWVQSYWATRRAEQRNAKYLAIRVVCVLDKYVEDCLDVLRDDGLDYGQRNSEGCRESQVRAPGPPIFPEDVDWKSIDHDLMYQILSMPSEVESAEGIIRAAGDISGPPDYEEWFEERKYHYAQFGIAAYKLSEDLCNRYGVKRKTYNDVDPISRFKEEWIEINDQRSKRMVEQRNFVEKYQPNLK